MILGIEIGGTKLQMGVARGDGQPLAALVRLDVEPVHAAQGILTQIRAAAAPLIARHGVERIGIGFGGPVDAATGRVLKSHQIEGWENFPIVDWCRQQLGLPAVLGNDADLAGLAEARYGAARGRNPVFYVTVGTGIGGGLILDGHVYRGAGASAAEIGHLRPGPAATGSEQTLESIASGRGIEMAARRRAAEGSDPPLRDLVARCGGADRITAQAVAEAAAAGNALAAEIFGNAVRALGWGIAQMITLLSPAAVVVGGGVSLAGEELFFRPLRAEVARFVFPPLADSYVLLPAALGEEMVVHGAIALAAQQTA